MSLAFQKEEHAWYHDKERIGGQTRAILRITCSTAGCGNTDKMPSGHDKHRTGDTDRVGKYFRRKGWELIDDKSGSAQCPRCVEKEREARRKAKAEAKLAKQKQQPIIVPAVVIKPVLAPTPIFKPAPVSVAVAQIVRPAIPVPVKASEVTVIPPKRRGTFGRIKGSKVINGKVVPPDQLAAHYAKAKTPPTTTMPITARSSEPSAIKTVGDTMNMTVTASPKSGKDIVDAMTPDQRERIRETVDAHFDKKSGRYIGSQTDQLLAQNLGVARAAVQHIREYFFGVLKGDPEIEDVLAQIRRYQVELRTLSDNFMNQSSNIEKELGKLQTRVENISRRYVPS